MKMNGAELLDHQLKEAKQARNTPVGIASYQYCLDERETIDQCGRATCTAHAKITLYWEDESISRHFLSMPPDSSDALPLERWRAMRYWVRDKRSGTKPVRLPALSVCDETIVSFVRKRSGLPVPDTWKAECTIHRRSFCHSNGSTLRETTTEAFLQPDPLYDLLCYRSRRFPRNVELEYLRTEQSWMARQPLRTVSRIDCEQDGVALFSPEALRCLLHHGFAKLVTDHRTWEHALPFVRHCASHSPLSVRHDPLAPWSLGSTCLTEDGFASQSTQLLLPGFQGNHSPLSYYQPAALHVDHPHKIRFHQWLPTQKHVYYFPTIQVAETFSPFSLESAWSPHACHFHNGAAVSQGECLLFFSLAALFSSPHITLVSKVGWDGFGLAVPVVDLVMTP
jgi:hypothetical protein